MLNIITTTQFVFKHRTKKNACYKLLSIICKLIKNILSITVNVIVYTN